jgi:hypothetical protein
MQGGKQQMLTLFKNMNHEDAETPEQTNTKEKKEYRLQRTMKYMDALIYLPTKYEIWKEARMPFVVPGSAKTFSSKIRRFDDYLW